MSRNSWLTGGLSLMDTAVVYDDFLLIGYNASEGIDYIHDSGRDMNSLDLFGHAPEGYQLAVKVARAYEILRQRFSAYSDTFVGDDEDDITIVILKSDWHTLAGALAHRSNDINRNVISVGYDHFSYEVVQEDIANAGDSYPADYIQGYTQNEQLLRVIFHETLHHAITLYLLDELPWAPEDLTQQYKLWQDNTLTLGDQTNTSNRPNLKYVELNNHMNEGRLAELLNFSPWNLAIALESATTGLAHFNSNPSLVEPDKHFFVIQ
jgi:hypothetical protein